MTKKRNIFEDLEIDAPAGAMKEQKSESIRSKSKIRNLIDAPNHTSRRAIRVWLYVLFALVSLMIVIGGLTRLTDSGLSITEWRPVTGALPPISDAAWQLEFDKYKQSPEYQLQNTFMQLADFKQIYWWEWGHRQLGRVIGLVWVVGFGFFMASRRIPAGWAKRLLIVGGLGALQGVVGWWMVASGLVGGRVDVQSYRLAVHLGLAFIILGVIAWYSFLLEKKEVDLIQARRVSEQKLFSLSTGMMHFAFLQIILGALVAGIDAGRAYPTWPDMNGQFFPADAFYVPDGNGGLLPVWHAFFENPGLVQFMHRMAGYALFVFAIIAWLEGRRSAYANTRQAFNLMMLVVIIQVGLGISTVINSAQLGIAIMHQIGAIVLWVIIIRMRYLTRYPTSRTIRSS